jgi:hypothetical protein
MSFSISGRNIPSVHSYADALEVWEGAHQHARFGENSRGLVNARDTSKTIRKHGDSIGFWYHHTCLVLYQPNALEVATYDSISSVIFSNRLLPMGIYAQGYKGGMYIRHGGNWLMPKRGTLRFGLVIGTYVLDTSTAYEFEHYDLDKKKAAAIRAKLKPFRQYRDALLRLRNGRNEATIGNRSQLAHVLRSLLMEPVSIGERDIEALLDYQPAYDDNFLLPTAYLAGGAVARVRSIHGPSKESAYRGNPANLYI